MGRGDSLSTAWVLALGIFLVVAVGVGSWAGYHVANEILAGRNRVATAPPVTAPPVTTAPARPPLAPPQTVVPAAPMATPMPPTTTAPPPTAPPPTMARATPTPRPATQPASRPVATTLPPARATQPPAPPPTAPRAPEPTVAPPQFTAADARRAPEDAYKDLWSALLRNDSATAKKYVPTAKLQTLHSERAVVADFMGLPVSQVQVGKTQTSNDKAVIFAKATSTSITDDKGKPAAIEVVVRMYKEGGYWKVLSQMWLVSTNPDRERQEAVSWMKASAAGGNEHGAAVARLESLGARFDADGFQAAVARNDVEQVRLFLQAGMSARTKLPNAGSALGLALLNLQGPDAAASDMAIALIRAGADIEERTPTGITPIMQAVMACKPRVIDALVTARARLDAKDNDGKGVLDWARRMCPNVEGPLRTAGAR